MKKCVEDAKIGTLRADWHGRWVSLSVDLLNIKWGGYVYHAVVNRQPTLEGKKPYQLCGGVLKTYFHRSNQIGSGIEVCVLS